MEQAVTLIFAKPINETYYEYGINNLERMKWIDRDNLRYLISNNVPREIISIKEIRELVEGYNSFVIDIKNNEYYTLDFEANPKDITNIVEEYRINKPIENKNTIISVMENTIKKSSKLFNSLLKKHNT